ncbi:MAG: VOC family protein [Gemmatimonadetes bacterium]|nr:VOC family protein [Gemmatimonadota bacterium]
MPRGIVDHQALGSEEVTSLRNMRPPAGLPFDIRKLGHVVLQVRDVRRSVEFYTQVLGFKVSDVYPDSMMAGKMVFMRCNPDHHGVALVGSARGESQHVELHHVAFEVGTIDEVFRAREHLRAHHVTIDFEGRRRAGCQIAVEFRDPDGHRLEIYWGLDQVGTNGVIRPPEEWREAFSLEEAVDTPPLGQDTTLHDPSLRRKT